MPEILVAATDSRENPTTVIYRERVTPADVQDDQSAARLVERVGWAIVDAEQKERDGEAADG